MLEFKEIEVRIPYAGDGDIGIEYNRLMEQSKDWVCFLDHDVLMLNPDWYYICIEVINRVGYSAGWITGTTNSIACHRQYKPYAPKNHNVLDHINFAKQEYAKYETTLSLMPQLIPIAFSGFMILTHKQAWKDAHGFPSGFTGVDNEYYRRLEHCGYNNYVIPGLYMYHIYDGKNQWSKNEV